MSIRYLLRYYFNNWKRQIEERIEEKRSDVNFLRAEERYLNEESDSESETEEEQEPPSLMQQMTLLFPPGTRNVEEDLERCKELLKRM